MSTLLLVDDRAENLLALEAILEPLGQQVVSVTSGMAALKYLLHNDCALILLDVQMPDLDGFETATLIKQRDKSRHIPIIFLTAISKDATNVFQGYEAGAVDYVMKPFDAHALRAKVAVFVELWEKGKQVEEQAERIRVQDLAEVQRVGEERYRFLAESIPQQVWTALGDGSLDYVNQQVLDYFGTVPEGLLHWTWTNTVHPEDLPAAIERWTQALETEDPLEVAVRLKRASDGVYRWHLSRAVAFRDEAGAVVKWFGTNTDMEDQKRAEERQQFLLEAGAALGASLDYERTLAEVASLSVPRIADWCVIALLEEGHLKQVAVAHQDPEKVQLVHELHERYPADEDASIGLHHVARTAESELMAEVPSDLAGRVARDDLHLELLQLLGLRSYMCVPLVARGRTMGALSFALAESGRNYGPDDLWLAEELARRAAIAIDNAQLYFEAERRAQAGKVLDTVGDGVFLVDREGTVILWNPAAEQITALRQADVLNRRAADVIPGWDAISPLVPVGSGPGTRAETVPLEVGGKERWLSISGVGFDEGTVYAFRDITEMHAVEEMKTDFVATVSHELRTPLAAIYGAAVTLRRDDLKVDESIRIRLLDVVTEESERLAQIVNDLLLASHLDSGRLQVAMRPTDVRELAVAVIDSAETHLPQNIVLKLISPKRLPAVAADPDQLRRVLVNLVDNAIKYSPEGGPVEVKLERSAENVRVSVRDHGLGIPPNEQQLIFEKFYRLDPDMNRGIGGTGLGLYISRELVHRLNGKIWVESANSAGSTFIVEIPVARPAKKPARAKAAQPS